MTKEPKAVLISDIHFSINTLYLASAALRAALKKAEELNVPLIIAGDLNDTKALIRAEVANELLDILKLSLTKIYILVGNHDKINEKGEDHGLNYLEPHATIVDKPMYVNDLTLIPYQSSNEYFLNVIAKFSKNKTIIAHQGFQGAFMGDYVQDKSSVHPDQVKDFRVISGHYHKHQTLGTVTYIGSPYSITYTEAKDGPKGFLVLNKDGSFTRELLNLRKHIVLDAIVSEYGLDFPEDMRSHINTADLLWLKVKGPYSLLKRLNKAHIGEKLIGHSSYKLDLIPTDDVKIEEPKQELTEKEILDSIINASSDLQEQKEYLRRLWREIMQSNS